MKQNTPPIPLVSVTCSQDGSSTKSNSLGMRPMQERAYQKRGEQYLLIKSPPASGKSRALMFIALDKLANQKLKQAIIQLVKTADGTVLKIADLVDDDPAKREKVSAALKDSAQKNNRDHVDIIIALGMAKEGFGASFLAVGGP